MSAVVCVLLFYHFFVHFFAAFVLLLQFFSGIFSTLALQEPEKEATYPVEPGKQRRGKPPTQPAVRAGTVLARRPRLALVLICKIDWGGLYQRGPLAHGESAAGLRFFGGHEGCGGPSTSGTRAHNAMLSGSTVCRHAPGGSACFRLAGRDKEDQKWFQGAPLRRRVPLQVKTQCGWSLQISGQSEFQSFPFPFPSPSTNGSNGRRRRLCHCPCSRKQQRHSGRQPASCRSDSYYGLGILRSTDWRFDVATAPECSEWAIVSGTVQQDRLQTAIWSPCRHYTGIRRAEGDLAETDPRNDCLLPTPDRLSTSILRRSNAEFPGRNKNRSNCSSPRFPPE